MGDEAHIAAQSPGGPRYGECAAHAVDGYDNLILLCKADHKRVDDQPGYFTAEILRKLKADHETWVHETLQEGDGAIRASFAGMRNEFSGTAYGPVVQVGHIDRLEVHHRPPVTHLKQLPSAAPLIGRSSELADLRSLVATAPATIVVNGPPWAGKSALAIAFAHEIVERYPDGQFYLDFGGNGGTPLSQEESLRWVLQSLGMSNAYIPDDLTHLASAYRSALAEQRVLVLLDNLAEYAVVDLFTTKAGLVLATCRGVPLFSNDVAKLQVGPLALADATAVLRHEAGAGIYWNGDDADRLARLCGGLPLALIAVARHLRSTTYSPGGLADLLGDGREPLSALSLNGTTLRGSLTVSYRRLPEAAQRIFRRLGSFPGETISSEAIKAVAGSDCEAGASRAIVTEGLLVEHWRGGIAELPVPFRLLAKEVSCQRRGSVRTCSNTRPVAGLLRGRR